MQSVTLLALELRGNRAISTAKEIQGIRAGSEQIDKLLRDYKQTEMSPAQAPLAQQLIEERTAFIRDGLQPTILLAEHCDATGSG